MRSTGPAVTLRIFGASLLGIGPGAGAAAAQCMLANPSFEIAGTSGHAFSGWNQSGGVASSPDATHGAVAALLSGSGPGSVSTVWQRLDAVPGEAWEITLRVRSSSQAPLSGGSTATVRVEWRNASSGLLGSETHVVADSSAPPGQPLLFTAITAAAPGGTARTHLILQLEQVGTSAPEVLYDDVQYWSLGPPTLEELQWTQYPGGRTVSFSGHDWRVKGPGVYGPGPSAFCDSSACVWTDTQGAMHLTVQQIGGAWSSTQVALEDPLGYGDYVVATRGRLDLLDPNLVLAMFLYQSGPCYDPATFWWNPFNEIDIEFSRWGVPGNDLAQFAVQPTGSAGTKVRFDATFADDEVTSHAFRWLPDRVDFRSWRGRPDEEATSVPIQSWTYQGPYLPRPEQPRLRFNLWQFQGMPPAAPAEVILEEFVFVPADSVPTAAGIAPAGPPDGLLAAWPNPGRAPMTVAYSAMRSGPVELSVLDVTGRRVRVLRSGPAAAGEHRISWDGRDARGNPVASGIYFYRLRAPGTSVTRRAVLVR